MPIIFMEKIYPLKIIGNAFPDTNGVSDSHPLCLFSSFFFYKWANWVSKQFARLIFKQINYRNYV